MVFVENYLTMGILHLREIHFNVSIWVIGVFYAIYKFSCTSNACRFSVNTFNHDTESLVSVFKDYSDAYNDFNSGWFFLGKRKDSADDEWETYLQALYTLSLWLCISAFVSNTLRRSSSPVVHYQKQCVTKISTNLMYFRFCNAGRSWYLCLS